MQSIGRYQIIRELGRGAMGVVYLAEDPAIGRQVAIKTINLDNMSEPGHEQMLRERLMKEARSAGILSHPGIVTVYDIQHSGNLACIVMEFVEGVTLHYRMVSGDLQPGEVLSVLEQTAAAMDFAHSKGVLHRDIKPANLMFTSAGQVKVADFGVARLSSQKTATVGMMLGTPAYMAPEQISNKQIGPATDQFSLAVVAFELITGQKPFSGDSISGLLYSIVFQDPISIRSLNPSLPAAAEVVLRKALSKESSDRYPSCSEFIRVLKIACDAKKSSWKPVRSIRGPQTTLPPEVAAAGAGMPAWDAAPQPPPATPSKPPVAPPLVSQPPIPPESKPKRETARMVVAFGASFLLILAAFFGWQSMQKPEASLSVASTPPVVLTPTPLPPGQAKPAAKPKPPVTEPATNAPAEPTRPEMYPVEVLTEPARANVSVKDQQCLSPCQLDLPPGEHYVKAELAGYKTAFQMVNVPKVLQVVIALQKPTGILEVRGPAGAIIHLNGKPWKDKAPARFSLPEGSYSVVLEHPDGTKTSEQKIDLTEGKIVSLN